MALARTQLRDLLRSSAILGETEQRRVRLRNSWYPGERAARSAVGPGVEQGLPAPMRARIGGALRGKLGRDVTDLLLVFEGHERQK